MIKKKRKKGRDKASELQVMCVIKKEMDLNRNDHFQLQVMCVIKKRNPNRSRGCSHNAN